MLSVNYIGLDDYTMMEPDYATSYTLIANDKTVKAEGDFNISINKSVYETTEDYASASSWHYSYNAYNGMSIQNHNIKSGNVLVLGDSFEMPMVPFLWGFIILS